ncbi:hypothetical protein SLA2020_452730 [Shorea laevis]
MSFGPLDIFDSSSSIGSSGSSDSENDTLFIPAIGVTSIPKEAEAMMHQDAAEEDEAMELETAVDMGEAEPRSPDMGGMNRLVMDLVMAYWNK